MGGGAADILIFPIGAMCLFAVAAFFAGFFSRFAALILAGLVLAIDLLFVLVIFQGSHWNVSWMHHLFTQPDFFGIVFGPAFLSIVGVLAPLRRAGIPRADGQRTPARPRWAIFVVASLATTFVLGYGAWLLLDTWIGERNTVALLSGNADIRMSSFKIKHQQRLVKCSDPAVLRYLEGRIRQHDPKYQGMGTTYGLSISYEGGGTASFATYWNEGNFSLYIGEAGEGGKGHGILLVHPRPGAVDELVHFLERDHREVAGTILILEPDGSRFERDESLVAH